MSEQIVPGVTRQPDGTIEIDISEVDAEQPHWLVGGQKKSAHEPVVKFNPNHLPGGSPQGGEFTGPGGGGGGGGIVIPSMAAELHTLPGATSAPVSAHHPYSDEQAARAAAQAAQTDFEAMLDRGAGLDVRLGADVVLPDAIGTVMNRIVTSGNPLIIIAPPKGARAADKVIAKYQGDWGKLTDMVRGTVAVDYADQVETAIHAIRAEMEAKGWRVAAAPEDRMTHPPDETGYRDVVLKLSAPNGLVAEVQIGTKAMIRAKEGEGHVLYERIRVLRETAAQTGWSHEAKAEYDDLVARSRKLYTAAWAASQRR